jgi:hypothetical protein
MTTGIAMKILFVLSGATLVLLVLWEAFETIVFPHRVTRRFRLTRLFYRSTWIFWSRAVRRFVAGRRQETYLSFYGPISLLLLLIFWATGLIIGFGLVHWASGSPIKLPGEPVSLSTYLYLSGTTFFTLGLGDVVPHGPFGRGLTAFESGIGFGFLALVIGYLPALNQSFARREVSISLLDARAGSPPTAAEMLRRHARDRGMEALERLLHEWELWSAEVLETHLSYPVLAYFRSQHDNQSWLGSLTAILDTCTLATVCLESTCQRQAELTFAMARHAVVDLAAIFNCPPREPASDRLPQPEWAYLRTTLEAVGLKFRSNIDGQKLRELRRMYEPYINALSGYFGTSVPPWILRESRTDNWQMTAWGKSSGFKEGSPKDDRKHRHF